LRPAPTPFEELLDAEEDHPYATRPSKVITYSPEPLEAPTSGDVLICCATPDGDVTLDL
jgi:hypothetical protein